MCVCVCVCVCVCMYLFICRCTLHHTQSQTHMDTMRHHGHNLSPHGLQHSFEVTTVVTSQAAAACVRRVPAPHQASAGAHGGDDKGPHRVNFFMSARPRGPSERFPPKHHVVLLTKEPRACAGAAARG